MLGRLLIGIVKGIIVGGLAGFGLVQLGFVAPGPIIAYAAAAAVGVLIGLIAGKPIWAKDAKIEAGMKAFVGALLGAGLMFAARKWLSMQVPFALGQLGAPNPTLGEALNSGGTFGGLAITSLAAVAAVIGGFYDADNTPSADAPAKTEKASAPATKKRIASPAEAEEDDLEGSETEKKQERQKR